MVNSNKLVMSFERVIMKQAVDTQLGRAIGASSCSSLDVRVSHDTWRHDPRQMWRQGAKCRQSGQR